MLPHPDTAARVADMGRVELLNEAAAYGRVKPAGRSRGGRTRLPRFTAASRHGVGYLLAAIGGVSAGSGCILVLKPCPARGRRLTDELMSLD